MKNTKTVVLAAIIILVIAFIYFSIRKNEINQNYSSVTTPPATNTPTISENGFPTQTNSEGGLLIEVTPKNLTMGNPAQFEVKFTTHVGNLEFDLTKQAVLFDDKNDQYAPTQWTGGAGGHHIEGELSFPAIPAETKNTKLIIKDVYGVPERVFEWRLP